MKADMDITISCNEILHQEQAKMLLDYANGLDSHTIAHRLGVSAAELKSIELDTRAVLGAKTQPHMISRAWQLGIISSKCLCVLLACLSAQIDDNMIRASRHAKGRAQSVSARIQTGTTGRNINA